MNPAAPRITDTLEKARAVNQVRSQYGTFAEIGAGQEVARWFFRAGGASGTIAKTISAYDMTISDTIYGPAERYVCRSRLQSMLEYEFRLLVERLDAKRGADTVFFSFADTVTTRSFKYHQEAHGWMGIRFQLHPRTPPNDIILHVRLFDKFALQQQEALGILGVNLIYGAFNISRRTSEFIESLLDGLNTERINIDMLKFSGPDFAMVDNRVVSLILVNKGLTRAAMFAPSGEVIQASEVMYNKPLLIERGTFRPITRVNLDMLAGAREIYHQMDSQTDPVEILEISTRNLVTGNTVDYEDFLFRADMIASTGKLTLISDYSEFYRLVEFFNTYTQAHIGIVLGTPTLSEILQEKYYAHLDGGILESFGRLFKKNVRLYVYPRLSRETQRLEGIEDLLQGNPSAPLVRYLIARKQIVEIQVKQPDLLRLSSREVAEKIQRNDPDWPQYVPESVAEIIRKRKAHSSLCSFQAEKTASSV
ncbi:MAG: TonB-dependent receptor [Methylacidiphilales bacterium]|nr:TonB-dependent receptor [Candidatus Methylacidiphilales bacterium]MDW8349171.1 TonB-dependent receptor [Verrucomicrobiae bacterium]